MSGFFTIGNAYKTYLDELGISGELVFRKAGIPFKSLDESGINLTKDQYIALMTSLDEITDDDHILAISNVGYLMMFVPPIFAAFCAKDGESCFNRLSKYKKLIGPFELNLSKDEETFSMSFVFDGNEQPIPRFTVLTEQVLMVGILRKATGLNIVPERVTSIYDYGDGRLAEYFGIEPEKSYKNQLTFRLKDLHEPFLSVNNHMWAYLEPELKRRMKEMESDNSFGAKVRSILFEMIPAGEDDIDSVAKELAISARTLQRKLSAENTTFIKQLDHTRELMARNYLKDKSISNDDVAFLIGYSDANAFGRAFRKWTGMTIGHYRKQFAAG